MAYLTRHQAVAAAGAYASSQVLLESEIRRTSAFDPGSSYDIFLSHASEDATIVVGVTRLLENEGLKVYVDWLVDRQVDRTKVSTATAHLLRTRMQRSRYLLYLSTSAAPRSRWMPWELGFFDGHRGADFIGVLPIVSAPGAAFKGQEYLGLYEPWEWLTTLGVGTFARRAGQRHESLRQRVGR